MEENYTFDKKEDISIEQIQEVVAKYFNINKEALILKKDKRVDIRYYRRIAMYLCRHLGNKGIFKISLAFGGTDSTIAMHAINVIKYEIENGNQVTKRFVEELTDILNKEMEKGDKNNN